MATWIFRCIDNGGKKQSLKIKASSKQEAIKTGIEKSKKNAIGNICPNWTCNLLKS